MNKTVKPAALLLISTHCPHCHVLETLLCDRKAKGMLGQLDIINIERFPEAAQRQGVRSVPWLRLGHFIFDEALTPAELDRWIKQVNTDHGQSHYVAYLLEHGKLAKAIEWIEQGNATLKAVIPLLADADVKINVRVGIGAILEHFEDTPNIRAIMPDLIALLNNDIPPIRTDACHYLSLTHSSDAIELLKKMLEDEDSQVREVAKESIDELSQYI